MRYRYTGHPYDESQRLYETPARSYDPTLGRFLSVDPRRQDASPYVYAGNNPVGFLDPTGGDEFPFYVYTGFETREVDRRMRSYKPDAVATAFGRSSSGNQYALSADMFNSRGDIQGIAIPSWAESDPRRYTIHSKVDYGKMYLFIGGERDVDNMERLAEGIGALQERRPEFARKVTIINFSGKERTGVHIRELFENAGRKPLLVHAGLKTGPSGGGGQKVTMFTSGSDEYSPSEFVAHVHHLEEAHADHPWIVGGTSETRSLPRDQLTPLGDPPHEIPLPQHELTPLGDPRHRTPLLLPPEPMDTSD